MKTNMHFYNIELSSSQNEKCFTQKLQRKSKHILCPIPFSPFIFENRAVYEMWKNIVQSDRPKRTTWRTRIACWIPKATNTHSEYVTLIAFPLQQWLHERLSMLRYPYSACIVVFKADVIEYYDVSGVTLIGMCGEFSWSSVKNSVSYASLHSTWPLIGCNSAKHSCERIIQCE